MLARRLVNYRSAKWRAELRPPLSVAASAERSKPIAGARPIGNAQVAMWAGRLRSHEKRAFLNIGSNSYVKLVVLFEHWFALISLVLLVLTAHMVLFLQ